MIQRRQLLYAILAALASPSISLSAMRGKPSDLRSGVEALDDSSFLPGCVIACEGPSSSGEAKIAPIDFWTSRVSDIESSYLTGICRRIVVWDDLFSLRCVARSMSDIFEAIPRFYGFDARYRPHQACIHLDQISSFGEVLSSLLSHRSKLLQSGRVAVVDLDSVGVTSLDWPRMLPHLRIHYERIVGLTYESSDLYDSEFSDVSGQRLSACFDHCDTTALLPARNSKTSDRLGYEEIVTCRTEFVAKLIGSLAGCC